MPLPLSQAALSFSDSPIQVCSPFCICRGSQLRVHRESSREHIFLQAGKSQEGRELTEVLVGGWGGGSWRSSWRARGLRKCWMSRQEGQALDSLGEGVPKWTSARRRQKAVSLWLTTSDLQGSHGYDECGPGLHPHPWHSLFGAHHLLPSHSLFPPPSHTVWLELSGCSCKGWLPGRLVCAALGFGH